jgi:starch synthase
LEKVAGSTPVIGIVSRFATQKGFDLVEQIAGKLSELDVAVVALGSGEPAYEKFFRDWAFWNKANVAVRIGYDDRAGPQDRGRRRHFSDALAL